MLGPHTELYGLLAWTGCHRVIVYRDFQKLGALFGIPQNKGELECIRVYHKAPDIWTHA